MFRTGEDSHLNKLILAMYDEFQAGQKYFDKAILGMIMQFFSILLRNYEKNAELSLENENEKRQASEILYYLQNHYIDSSLTEVADKFGYSASHFSKLIKKSTGYTYTELITRQRMEQSNYLLKNSNFTVSKIAELVGYPNVEHFNRTFKKNFKTSPSKYRLEK